MNYDSLTKIKILSLPGNGILKLEVNEVKLNQEISNSSLGKLTFHPKPNWSGFTKFEW